MKKLLVFASFMVLSFGVFAQQRPQYSQYMINPFILNPAVAGVENYADIKASYRNQWTGFSGSPTTFYLSGHAPIGKSMCMNTRTKHRKPGYHGVGGYIMVDKTGPSKRIELSASYAYHLKLAKDLFVSLGMSGGIQQFRLDGNALDIVRNTESDYFVGSEVIANNGQAYVPEFNAGTWIYSSNFFAGASLSQILRPNINFAFNGQEPRDIGKLTHHYFIIAGYRYKVDRDLSIIPSFTLKGVAPAPMSFDINCKARYKDAYWGGLSYRRGDAVSIMGGIVIEKMFDVSYAYDITLSDIRKYSGGSHEIIVGYRIPMRVALVCPSHFW